MRIGILSTPGKLHLEDASNSLESPETEIIMLAGGRYCYQVSAASHVHVPMWAHHVCMNVRSKHSCTEQ